MAEVLTAVAPRGLAVRHWGRFTGTRSAQIGFACVILVVLLALLGPILFGSPYHQALLRRLAPPDLRMGDLYGLLGTDQLGRSVLARLAYGARLSLTIAILAVLIAGVLGVTAGLCAGFYGGWPERIVMRLADVQLAFPFILFVILVVGAVGTNTRNLVAVLGISGWALYARVVRAEVLKIREQEYIEAARSIGVRNTEVIVRHILPNVLPPVIVIVTSATAQMIIAEAALSFLGLGVQPPGASLGTMLSDGREYLTIDPWLATIPGVTIMVAVLGINLLGDWLRDLLDPRLKI